MALSEAQKRAQSKYAKKVKQVIVKFYPNNVEDQEMYEFLKSMDNINAYIKNLIRRDM